MIKYNQHTLNKLENIFKESDIQVRYGKGSFSSGYCILEDKNIIVVNRYFSIEVRVQTLIDLLDRVLVKEDQLTEISMKMYQTVCKEKSKEKAAPVEAEAALTE